MRNNPLAAVVRRLRMRAGVAVESSPDAQLLARFIQDRDETAFEEIVRRHGPLVWALCRGGLQTADAEDAFQATFVVLARRAAYIRKPASLACWLSGVARRVVGTARKRSTRRLANLPPDAAAAATDDRDRREWREVLNQELDRLPDKYRLPTLLCYYQGLTNEEAAARLGWPHGTVTGRLARARELLRRGLARKGLTLTAGALTVGATGPPPDVVAATFRMCSELIGAKTAAGSVAGSVLQLAEGAMYTIWVEKVRMWAIGIVAITALGGGTGWVLVPASAQTGQVTPPPVGGRVAGPFPQLADEPPPSLITPEAIAAEIERLRANELKAIALAEFAPNEDEIQKLRKRCYRAAHTELTARMDAFQAGTTQGTIDILLECITKHLLVAELALSDRPADKLVAYNRALSILKLVEAVNYVRFRAGRIPIQDLEQTRFERLNMEIKVLEAKRAANSDSPIRR